MVHDFLNMAKDILTNLTQLAKFHSIADHLNSCLNKIIMILNLLINIWDESITLEELEICFVILDFFNFTKLAEVNIWNSRDTSTAINAGWGINFYLYIFVDIIFYDPGLCSSAGY